MFEFLKRHKREDFEDIRSTVLSEKMNEPDFPREEFGDPMKPMLSDRPPQEPPRVRGRFEEPEPRFEEPPGFSSIDTRPALREREAERNYDLMDRLNLMENQLSAIRSMTETINERLKNMERQLPRRY
jgi:hypothetical protein